MDKLCLKIGISGLSPSLSITGCLDARSSLSQVSAVRRSTSEKIKSSKKKSMFLRSSLTSLCPRESGNKNNRYNALDLDDVVLVENKEGDEDGGCVMEPEGQNGNWVFKILHAKSMWKRERANDQRNGEDDDDNEEECEACRVNYDDEAEFEFDRDSFSQMLRKVSLDEARFYAQMSYIGNLAYCIPEIKTGELLRCYGLRFVTSSMEKREMEEESNEEKEGDGLRESSAYQAVASAASYLRDQTKSIFPFKFSNDEGLDEVASLKANTTNSATTIVAAKNEVKQAIADDLNSTCSSPCQWYVCDDEQSGTRFFVIQGSESLASWQANLLFEPIQFEGFDVLVHRGIYEAAKGIYKEMLPEVHAHLESQGDGATFSFTGHSLGGSLALLVNLMMLIRQQVPLSSLLPVITFGAPSIMCGGDSLLHKLGLPRSHVHAITLHRDIVSRSLSCNYPNHVVELLKAVNANFRNHSCLKNQKIIYAPMGELVILQPEGTFSPHHHLLPPGSGLYLLSDSNLCESNKDKASKKLQAAKLGFLNSPHPLEILSERSAYGSGGTIIRDHDMKSYLESLRSVICQELKSIRKERKGHRQMLWWNLSAPRTASDHGSVVDDKYMHFLWHLNNRERTHACSS